jgi:UPF0755 protein
MGYTVFSNERARIRGFPGTAHPGWNMALQFLRTFFSFFRRHFKNVLLAVLNLVVLAPLAVLLAGSVWQLYVDRHGPPPDGERHFIIVKHQNANEIARALEKEGIIVSSERFLTWIRRWNMDRRIQSGKFSFERPHTLFQVIWKLVHSFAFVEKITVPEGLDMKRTARLFTRLGIPEERFLERCRDPALIRDLGLHVDNLEGYLFPDTYRFMHGSGAEKVIRTLVRRFFQVIESIEVTRSLIYKTTGLNQGLIIASLVEKETRYLPERARVASVFWNRLKKGWRLDSDVTVRYALDKWDALLTRDDLKIRSPYNTRRYKGLPPGPICSPGASALRAAFFPERSEWMFFIASGEENGASLFSKTLEQHNRIKRRLHKEGKLG